MLLYLYVSMGMQHRLPEIWMSPMAAQAAVGQSAQSAVEYMYMSRGSTLLHVE